MPFAFRSAVVLQAMQNCWSHPMTASRWILLSASLEDTQRPVCGTYYDGKHLRLKGTIAAGMYLNACTCLDKPTQANYKIIQESSMTAMGTAESGCCRDHEHREAARDMRSPMHKSELHS